MRMTKDQAKGMFVGLFVGDAMGAPLEFTKPNTGEPVTTMIGGGVHGMAVGEYSDDGAMAMAIADAYIKEQGFNASTIQKNFLDWFDTGKFGTRDYAFDVGMTVAGALNRVKNVLHPYTGSTDSRTSGNGCIMRMAPCIVWNRKSLSSAIAESVAQAILTHGSADSIKYTAALAHELWMGRPLSEFDELRDRHIRNSGYVADTYASAWHSVISTSSFDDAVVDAINRGCDADTVGAVTGMICGRMYGYESIKKSSLAIRKFDEIVMTFKHLYSH